MSDRVYAAIKTALVVFVATFIPTLFGFLHEVQEWASDVDGAELNFASLEPLGKGLVSAAIAAIAGLLNYVVNALQEHGKLPGKAAKYDPK